jgi:hypothetical protein
MTDAATSFSTAIDVPEKIWKRTARATGRNASLAEALAAFAMPNALGVSASAGCSSSSFFAGSGTFKRRQGKRLMGRGSNMVLESVMFHRRNDALHEYRELNLRGDGEYFSIWQSVGFLKDPGYWQRDQIAFGHERDIRPRFNHEIRRLVNEGFTQLKVAAPTQRV